jgi:N-acetylmuramoyl-L-alanine amidase
MKKVLRLCLAGVLAITLPSVLATRSTEAGAAAQQTQPGTEMGFVKQNDYFPQSKLPMTADERRLRGALSHFLDRLGRHDPLRPSNDDLPKVSGHSLLNVKISGTTVLLNFESKVLAGHELESFQDIFTYLNVEIDDQLNKWHKAGSYNVLFVFDGYGINHYYPRPKQKSSAILPPPLSDVVVVSAGHGVYHKYNSTGTKYTGWFFQRDPAPSDPTYIEDQMTQYFASTLTTILRNKSGADVRLARKLDNSTIDPESGYVWRDMAARYRFAQLLPGQPAIWNSDTSGAQHEPMLHEENQDIRSRPYYANYIGAQGLLSLHTNAQANGGTSAHGGWVIYDTNVPGSEELANLVAFCLWMRGREVNANYTAVTKNGTDNYGELRLSQVPSVIVEIAFHTNADDVKLLENPTFRAAAMTGVEQGWRNFRTTQQIESCPS